MSLDLTTALGRLLTDAGLRYRFFENRAAIATQLAVAPSVVDILLQLDEETLEQQALGLIAKRFHEVKKFLPITTRQNGEKVRHWFQQYANHFWPETHRRHLIDAWEFCRYLQNHQLGSVCKTERNRIAFRLRSRRLAIHFVSDFHVARKRRWAIQFLTRSKKGNLNENVWYLRFPAWAFNTLLTKNTGRAGNTPAAFFLRDKP